MRLPLAVYGVLLCVCFVTIASPQDATKVDAKHYTVISENARLRIVKVHYGPHEKSVMHSHPAGVAVFLTDSKVRFTFPDGKTQDVTTKAGDAQYTEAVTHLPENMDDKGMDVILVELKGKTAHPANTDMKMK